MSKESERLFRLLGEVEETMVEKAVPSSKHSPIHYRRYAGLAACFAVVVLSFSLFPRMGCGSSGGGRRDAENYMSYFGPVLPLSSVEAVPEIKASRQLSFDFAQDPDGDERAGQKAKVQDEYTLTNGSDQDRTVELVYPFVISSTDDADRLPVITQNGEPVETHLSVGAAVSSDEENGNSWVKLGEENALKKALIPPQKLGRGVVYTITENRLPKDDLHHQLGAELSADWSRSGWWSYGISTIEKNEDAVWLGLERKQDGTKPVRGYIIPVGEDFEAVRFAGKSWKESVEKAKPDPNITGTVTREEAELDPLLLQLGREYLAGREDRYWGLAEAQRDAVFMDSVRRETEDFLSCGIERCEPIFLDRLEDFFESVSQRRLLAARFEITIPAGQSVQIKAEFVRDGSHDFAGSRQEEWGYDLLTSFGGGLAIKEQTLTLKNTQKIELVRDDCGFDLKNGKNTVTLDLQKALYEFAVQQKPQK